MHLSLLLAQTTDGNASLIEIVIYFVLTWGPLVVVMAILIPMLVSMLRSSSEARRKSYEHMERIEQMTQELLQVTTEVRDHLKSSPPPTQSQTASDPESQ